MEIGWILQVVITIGMFVSFALLVFFSVKTVKLDKTGKEAEEKKQRLSRALLICALVFLFFCAALYFGGKLNLPGWDSEIYFSPNQK